MTKSKGLIPPVPRDDSGKFLPGTVPNPRGRPRKENTMRDIIERNLAEIVGLYYEGKEIEYQTKKQMLAKHLTDMVVFGQIRLPTDNPEEKGRVLKFRADDYMKHLIRLLRYIEPPEADNNMIQGIANIIWDLPMGQDIRARQAKLEVNELLVENKEEDGDSE